MPRIVMRWYPGKTIELQPKETEKIIRDFVDDIGDSGGILEFQCVFCESPSRCDSDIVIEAHYGRSDDRDSIQEQAAFVMKKRLEELLRRSVSVRLLPKDNAIFIK